MPSSESSPDLEKKHTQDHGATVSTKEVDTGAALVAGDHAVLDETESIRLRYILRTACS
jgi:hypothetical protein